MYSELSDRDFWRFSKLVHDKCGIELHEGKKELVRARLSKRLRQGGFQDFKTYYNFVMDDANGDELVQMLDAISTNLTSFFREEKHFDFLVNTVFPSFDARPGRTKRIRAWSAGCSSGEEPYSLAMCLLEYGNGSKPLDAKILATDISTRVLSRAQRGMYDSDRVEKIPGQLLRKFFQKGIGHQEGNYVLKSAVKDLVVFRRFNLMDPFPFSELFDFIFCRNVMIYFNKQVQESLVNKYYNSLVSGGYLIIGHSESLTGINHGFKYVQPTIYRK